MLQQAPNTHLWLIPDPLALVFRILSISLIFIVKLAKLALRLVKFFSIWSMHSLIVSTSSTLTGALRRLATVVYIALNYVIFASTYSAICETSSCHYCTISRYSSSRARSFYNSPYSFLFSPIIIIRCIGGMSFITVVTTSNSY